MILNQKTSRTGIAASSILVAATVVSVAVIAALVGLTKPYLLGDPGDLVRWGLPVVKALTNISMAGAIGGAVFAAFALGDRSQELHRAHNLVAASGVGWVIFGSVSYLFTYLSITGTTLSFDAQFSAGLELFATQIALGQSLALNLAGGLVVATLAFVVRSIKGSFYLSAVGLASLVPLAVSGHASGTAGHAMAVNAIGMHLVAIVIWVGGLVALMVVWGGVATEERHRLLKRYSTLALVAFVLTAVSGVASSLVRITVPELFTTTYGLLILAKVVALVLLGCFGAVYRLKLIGATPADLKQRVLVAVVLVELVVMGVAVALATALARTGAPAPTDIVDDPSPARILTGSDLPPELTADRWFSEWRFDLVWSTICLIAAVAYVWGVIRLRRRGDVWSLARTASWLAGIALLMTVGVYGLVAAIVKLDDLGLHLSRRDSAAARAVGLSLLRAAPWLMKALSVAGTAAMFLVGGSILLHGIAPLHHAVQAVLAGWGTLGATLGGMAVEALVGILAGALVLAAVSLGQRAWRLKGTA